MSAKDEFKAYKLVKWYGRFFCPADTFWLFLSYCQDECSCTLYLVIPAIVLFFLKKFYLLLEYNYKVVFISAVQQSESAIYIYIYIYPSLLNFFLTLNLTHLGHIRSLS